MRGNGGGKHKLWSKWSKYSYFRIFHVVVEKIVDCTRHGALTTMDIIWPHKQPSLHRGPWLSRPVPATSALWPWQSPRSCSRGSPPLLPLFFSPMKIKYAERGRLGAFGSFL